MPSVRDAVDGWRTGSHRSQRTVLLVLLGCVVASLAVSLLAYGWFPVSGFYLWLLTGMLLLRFRQLVVLAAATLVAGITTRLMVGEMSGGRVAAVLALSASVSLVLYASSRQRAGLPGPLSEALLADLRDRLDAQGRVPELPCGWRCETAMKPAYGVGYAGDFMVVDLDRDDAEGPRLDLVLVDVVGKGVRAAPAALLLAGALGGLVGSVRGAALLDAANQFLLHQPDDAEDTFATAVHVSLDLATGAYAIRSAGHPPALRWSAAAREWEVDAARGLALGVLPHPEVEASEGVLAPGEALLFYTDGVVETRSADLDAGIAWLQRTAAVAMQTGSAGAARRIVDQVPRGDDDRAVLLLTRDG